MAASGEATIDFTSTPSRSASVAVTGQGAFVAATSKVDCWLQPKDISATTEDDHVLAEFNRVMTIWIPVSLRVDGVGFTIKVEADVPMVGQWNIGWAWA